MKEIKFPIAKNIHGEHIKIANSTKSEQYFCLGCNNELIPISIGNPSPIQAPHYRHKEQNITCHWEKALQVAFKIETFKLLQHHIDNNLPIGIEWICGYCNEKHKGNLLRNASAIELDYDFENSIIQIALLNKKGKIYAAIHFVVKNLFLPTQN